MTRSRGLVLASLALGLLAQGACPLSTVVIVAPRGGTLTDDPALAIAVDVGRNFPANANVVRVDGVDLAAALGLAPPFADASGVVSLGGVPVSITGFTYAVDPDAVRIRALLSGLAEGLHLVEAEAFPASAAPVRQTASFEVLAEPFALALDATPAAGGPANPVVSATRIGASALGEAVAGPPVSGDGGSLRPGFVSATR